MNTKKRPFLSRLGLGLSVSTIILWTANVCIIVRAANNSTDFPSKAVYTALTQASCALSLLALVISAIAYSLDKRKQRSKKASLGGLILSVACLAAIFTTPFVANLFVKSEHMEITLPDTTDSTNATAPTGIRIEILPDDIVNFCDQENGKTISATIHKNGLEQFKETLHQLDSATVNKLYSGETQLTLYAHKDIDYERMVEYITFINILKIPNYTLATSQPHNP